MKNNRSFRQWLLLTLLIYAIQVGVFIASELFKNTQYLIYPSVFILILTAFIGPSIVAGTIPSETAEKHPYITLAVRICVYPFFWFSMRLISTGLYRIGLL